MNFWVCPSCGKKVAEKIKSCPHCKALKQAETTSYPESTVNNYKAAIIVLTLIIIAVGAYLVVSGDKDQANTKTNEIANTSSEAPQKTKTIKQKDLPPAALDAFKAFKKMQARTQVGIAYNSYSEALADVRLALNMYMESTASKEFIELTAGLKKAYLCYDLAGKIWKEKFRGSSGPEALIPKVFYPQLFDAFPDSDKEIKDGGVVYKGYDKEYIDIDTAVSYLFSKSSEEIQKASRLIER